MVNRKITQIVLLIAIIVGAFFLYRYLFPSAERQIIRRLNNLATDASFAVGSEGQLKPGQITSGLFAKRVTDYFTRDATLVLEDIDGYSRSLTGSEEIRQSLFAARSQLDSLIVAILDPQVRVESPGRSGQVSATARVSWEEAGQKLILSARELSIGLVKLDRQWFISRLETVSVIKR
ncbi:MAG TPA: hypothetical protein VJB69_02205 [Candidatus Paceibacterota bacterium]